jgi:hypothetical protein
VKPELKLVFTIDLVSNTSNLAPGLVNRHH